MNRTELPSIPIIFENQHFWVIDKPAGIPSQPDSHKIPCLSDILKKQLNAKYIGLIHRLDRNTSGLMCLAKNQNSAAKLTQLLQANKIRRTYLAWTVGRIPEELSGQSITHYLWKNAKNNKTTIFKKPTPDALEATLKLWPKSYFHLKRDNLTEQVLTLAQFELETGRSHQIRAQSQALGFPIVGDIKYSSKEKGIPFSRTLLHSYSIEIQDLPPYECSELKSEIPFDFYLPNIGPNIKLESNYFDML